MFNQNNIKPPFGYTIEQAKSFNTRQRMIFTFFYFLKKKYMGNTIAQKRNTNKNEKSPILNIPYPIITKILKQTFEAERLELTLSDNLCTFKSIDGKWFICEFDKDNYPITSIDFPGHKIQQICCNNDVVACLTDKSIFILEERGDDESLFKLSYEDGTDKIGFKQHNLEEPVHSIHLGDEAIIFRMENDRYFIVGNNDSGQLGMKPDQPLLPMTLLQLDQINRVITKDKHTFIFTENGKVFACGSNKFGELGVNLEDEIIDQPLEITIPNETIVDIFISETRTFYLTASNKLFASGQNTYQALGLGHIHDEIIRKPTLVDINEKVSKVIFTDVCTLFATEKNVYVCGHIDDLTKDYDTVIKSTPININTLPLFSDLNNECIIDISTMESNNDNDALYFLTKSGKVLEYEDGACCVIEIDKKIYDQTSIAKMITSNDSLLFITEHENRIFKLNERGSEGPMLTLLYDNNYPVIHDINIDHDNESNSFDDSLDGNIYSDEEYTNTNKKRDNPDSQNENDDDKIEITKRNKK